MPFVLQQPGSTSLLDALDDAANGAEAGGGAFAFATASGIRSLLTAPSINGLLHGRAPFHLIVGVDAITNGASLLQLEEAAQEFDGMLKTQAFIHSYPGTFHPKFAWFRHPTHLTLITGSGNLTASGLGSHAPRVPPRGNWEAFVVQCLRDVDAAETYQTISTWIDQNTQLGYLRPVNDSEVRDQAMANSRIRWKTPTRSRQQHDPLGEAPIVIHPEVPEDDAIAEHDVLLRELPRTRPGQADIGRQGLRFFGFNEAPVTIFLQYVRLDNSVEPTVEQRLFVNASRNYRVEMGPIAQLGYLIDADDNRMILVAVRLNERSFRYTLVPIAHPAYTAVSALLGPSARAGGNRPMRILETTSSMLRQAWPEAPENLLPVLGLAIET